MAAQYRSAEQRDTALKLLEREKVRYKEKSYELVVRSTFGKDTTTASSKPAVWFMDCGIIQPKDLARALFGHFYLRARAIPEQVSLIPVVCPLFPPSNTPS